MNRRFRNLIFLLILSLCFASISEARPAPISSTIKYHEYFTKTDANGITVQYAYDSLNRLTNIQFPDSSENIAYTYDNCINGIGRLCYMTDPSGTTTYEYDSLGRTVKETKTILGIAYTTTYAYDKTGSLTTITYPSGRKVSYTYNSVYRPTGVIQQMNKGKTSLVANILYDKARNMVSMTLGNKITQQWTYDAKNRISTITVPAIFALNYTYDPLGNITSIIDHHNPANIKTYIYDSLDRLTNAAGPWGNLNWTYDANGNRLTQINNKTSLYTYEANRLTSITTNNNVKAYQYDNNGNTISNGKLNFIYNQNNRLMKAVADGKVLGEYTYNGKGQRVIKKTKQDDQGDDDDGEYGHHIIFHYDLTGRLIEETKANGKLIADYIYLNGSPLAMIRKQHHQEETFYYHNDHLGTPKVMTDKLKKIVWNVEFDPFGNEIKHNHGRHGKYIRKVKNNLRFPGQYFDKETGLHQNYFRDYDPKTGAYPQGDPIGLLGGMNPYSYGNNPVNWIDPLGLWGIGIIGTETTEAGLVIVGAGQNGSIGGGFFATGFFKKPNLGGFASWGGFAGGPGYGPSYPSGNSGNVVGGAYAGVGAGIYGTNAKCAEDLKGPFKTLSFNVGYGPFKFTAQVSYGNGIWIGSFGPPLTGVGIGISGSGYNTNTWTTKN